MEINWSIVGWIAGLVFVYVFGLFEGRSQGYKRRKAEEQQEKKDHPAQDKPATITVDDPGMLRIKNDNGSLTLDLDGARADTSALSSDQRKRLIELLTLMRPWLEGRTAAPSMTSPPPPPNPSTPLRASPMPAPVKTATPSARPTPPPQAAAKSPAQDDRPVAPANSIVGQIDSILQMRLNGTLLEGRGVFLAQSPEGGVIVYVGLDKYMGLDDVPDSESKAAIRDAIAEWENKYTPGL